jgi:hypothetical protein
MKKKCILLISMFFSVPFIYGQNEIFFELEDFQSHFVLKGEKMQLKQPLDNPVQMIIADSLLFLQNLNRDIVTDILNINTGEIMASFCKRGRGPGEIIYPFPPQFIEETNEFLVHDLNGKKGVFYSINLVMNGESKNYTKIVKINSIYPRRLKLVKDNTFFCGLLGHEEGYMNCKIDMEGIVTKWVNKFPEIGVKYNKIVASNLFPTDVSVSPDLTKVVVSYSYSGRIDIFDFTGTLLLNYFGPDYKKLDISLSEKTKAPALTSKNVETYWSADLNNKSFMIPYSGKKRTKSTLYENVLHFDYEGN